METGPSECSCLPRVASCSTPTRTPTVGRSRASTRSVLARPASCSGRRSWASNASGPKRATDPSGPSVCWDRTERPYGRPTPRWRAAARSAPSVQGVGGASVRVAWSRSSRATARACSASASRTAWPRATLTSAPASSVPTARRTVTPKCACRRRAPSGAGWRARGESPYRGWRSRRGHDRPRGGRTPRTATARGPDPGCAASPTRKVASSSVGSETWATGSTPRP